MEKVWAALETAQLDSLWVTTPENVRYLSGFTAPEDARVLLQAGSATLFTDSRYIVQAEEESPLPAFIWRQGDEWKAELKRRLEGVMVGFEASNLTVAALEELKELGGLNWTSSKGTLEAVRRVKTPDEVSKMRRAGADGAAFEIIVASGPRSAMPHGTASSRQLESGDLVTIDLGAKLGGYHSDMTRAYPVGEVSTELKRLYRAVKEAKRQALESARAGVGCKALDAVARDYLTLEGYGQAFAHSLGHGVGLAVHEAPRLSFRSPDDEVLELGNVVTLEPGVYLPGVGGVRLEDMVLILETGCEVLTGSAEVDL